MLALFTLAFAFRLEVYSPYFSMRFGPQWPRGVEISSAPAAPANSAPAAQSGAQSGAQPADSSPGLGSLPKVQPTGATQSAGEAGGPGIQVELEVGAGGVQVGAGVPGVAVGAEVGGHGVQAGAQVGGTSVGAGVGGEDGVQLGVDTGLGIGAEVGVDPDEGISVNVDLPGDDLDLGVNLGSGGCTVWLLGQCILP